MQKRFDKIETEEKPDDYLVEWLTASSFTHGALKGDKFGCGDFCKKKVE